LHQSYERTDYSCTNQYDGSYQLDVFKIHGVKRGRTVPSEIPIGTVPEVAQARGYLEVSSVEVSLLSEAAVSAART
jgi:hypothetical protein